MSNDEKFEDGGEFDLGLDENLADESSREEEAPMSENKKKIALKRVIAVVVCVLVATWLFSTFQERREEIEQLRVQNAQNQAQTVALQKELEGLKTQQVTVSPTGGTTLLPPPPPVAESQAPALPPSSEASGNAYASVPPTSEGAIQTTVSPTGGTTLLPPPPPVNDGAAQTAAPPTSDRIALTSSANGGFPGGNHEFNSQGLDVTERGNIPVTPVDALNRRVDGDVYVPVTQGERPNLGDKTLLWNAGRAVKVIPDVNGHHDGSPVNGQAFSKPRRILSGSGVFVTQYKMVNLPNGKRVRVAINLVLVAPNGATILRNGDVWNLREWGIEQNAYLMELAPQEIWEGEASYAGGRNDKSYFALYVAKPGEEINPKLVANELLVKGEFYTLSDGLPPRLTDYMPVKTAGR
jgi:hypothetical protein